MIEDSYIEIFRSNREMIDAGSSAVMNGVRDAAFDCFVRNGLPDKRQEQYLHTDVAEWFAPNWGINLHSVNNPIQIAESFRCNVPNLSTKLYYLANDRFVESEVSKRTPISDGVLAGSLQELSIKYPELIKKYYNRLADMDRKGIAALNAMYAQDGFMLYVPADVQLDKPIQLVTLLQSTVDQLVSRRILIVLEDGASAGVLLCDHAMNSRKFMTSQVIEAFVGHDASLELYDLEETHVDNNRVCELFLSQMESSKVTINNITLHNGNTRNSVYVNLCGRGAELDLDGVVITDKKQHVDNLTFVDHRAADCISNELFKYVLNDESVGIFAGKILVREGSQHTISEQVNRNICLTRQARMYTQPQLEIYADDVKCSHGATVGQLDDKALFYMQQRGISADEARMMLMLAFVNQVIDRVKIDPLRDRLKHLVEMRFRGELSKCEGCSICR